MGCGFRRLFGRIFCCHILNWNYQISGSSDVFLYGIVCYSNNSKIKFLNVNEETLGKHGAVSKQTVEEMLYGLNSQCSENFFGIAISGVAGPGKSEKKPVGNVFIGIIGNFCDLLIVKELNFGQLGREEIRMQTVRKALSLCLNQARLIKS